MSVETIKAPLPYGMPDTPEVRGNLQRFIATNRMAIQSQAEYIAKLCDIPDADVVVHKTGPHTLIRVSVCGSVTTTRHYKAKGATELTEPPRFGEDLAEVAALLYRNGWHIFDIALYTNELACTIEQHLNKVPRRRLCRD